MFTGLLLRLPSPESGTHLPSNHPPAPSASTTRNAARIPPLPALTTYRAHMMLMTVLAILAVDFPVFPRSLVKCETFGVSLVWAWTMTLSRPKLTFGNLDGPGSWIFCVFTRHCLCYATYQRPCPFIVPNRTQVTICDSQIVPNHRSRSYPSYSRKRNGLSCKSSTWPFFLFVLNWL